MRGKRAVGTFYLYNPGITPAGAGKTNKRWLCIAIAQDHPRRCGENFAGKNPYRAALGSPPQVRGKPVLRNASTSRRRITPAGAGKTRRFRCFPAPPEDHPRRCGENKGDCTLLARHSGSPPQVRGKHVTLWAVYARTRITPAGAGKTAEVVDLAHYLEDHPRRCGENSPRMPMPETAWGSPPQVRGKLTEKIDV